MEYLSLLDFVLDELHHKHGIQSFLVKDTVHEIQTSIPPEDWSAGSSWKFIERVTSPDGYPNYLPWLSKCVILYCLSQDEKDYYIYAVVSTRLSDVAKHIIAKVM